MTGFKFDATIDHRRRPAAPPQSLLRRQADLGHSREPRPPLHQGARRRARGDRARADRDRLRRRHEPARVVVIEFKLPIDAVTYKDSLKELKDITPWGPGREFWFGMLINDNDAPGNEHAGLPPLAAVVQQLHRQGGGGPGRPRVAGAREGVAARGWPGIGAAVTRAFVACPNPCAIYDAGVVDRDRAPRGLRPRDVSRRSHPSGPDGRVDHPRTTRQTVRLAPRSDAGIARSNLRPYGESRLLIMTRSYRRHRPSLGPPPEPVPRRRT